MSSGGQHESGLLQRAVFEDAEVGRRQIGNRSAVLVEYRDAQRHQLDAGVEGRGDLGAGLPGELR